MKINFGLENNIIANDVEVEAGGFFFGAVRDVDSERQMNGWNMENEWRILQVPFVRRRTEKRLSSAAVPVTFVPRMICCCLCGFGLARGVPNANSHLLFRFYYKRKLFGQLQSCEGEAHAH